ncbi:hypothetical protein, conserved [Entamoeba dispar SAW760]|uniref:Leucine rich repeat containing protein BspA family protein n=1 Tax=Entamoeba dispar (strain ATCC PRA-260 / SAW760) TaxID=370354 RepID=B0EC61_ENTDS|nr:uncharacterized protein EDI_125560 [Entamoeba dispar SAW760]EDR27909.1 hypothetical protein, conserved [Entamoeba dispar SAW760]|eukprot:EDR27909.1 hypothetical protein, conserved [Entamoeba dispar SAW760]
MKQLDGYSILIVGKYFQNIHDYFNITLVNSKFKLTLEKYHYNPIPITLKMKKYFPNLQTQIIYSNDEPILKGIQNIVYDCKIEYSTYVKIIQENKTNRIQRKFLRVEYSIYDRDDFGDTIPIQANYLGYYAYGNYSLKTLNIPESIKVLSPRCLCKNSLHSLIIPSSIHSLPISCCYLCNFLTSIQLSTTLGSIGAFCFYGCSSLKTIIIPSSVSFIGSSCFEKCLSLKSLVIPDCINTLNERLFQDCTSLTSIHIPSSVTRIRNNCFFNCLSLQKFDYHPFDKTIKFSIPLFTKPLFESAGIKTPFIKFTKYDRLKNGNIIPPSVTSLEKYCFAGLPSLSSICIPSSVTKIGKGCFSNSDYIETMSIPSSVKVFGTNCLSWRLSTYYSFC